MLLNDKIKKKQKKKHYYNKKTCLQVWLQWLPTPFRVLLILINKFFSIAKNTI
jgi:hypothetical protein